jgi:hypothetical protein
MEHFHQMVTAGIYTMKMEMSSQQRAVSWSEKIRGNFQAENSKKLGGAQGISLSAYLSYHHVST